MSENLHDIDKLFKEGIDSYEEAPAPTLWNSIENNLDKEDTVRLRRTNRFLKRGALVLLVFLGISLIFLYKYSNRNTPADNSSQPSLSTTDSINNNNLVSKEEKDNSSKNEIQEFLPTGDSNLPTTEKGTNKSVTKTPVPVTEKNNEPITTNKTSKKQDIAVNDIEPTTHASNETASSETNKRKKETINEGNVSVTTKNKSSIVKSKKESKRNNEFSNDAIATGNKKKINKSSQKKPDELLKKEVSPSSDFISGKNPTINNGSASTAVASEERKQSWEALKGISMLDRTAIRPAGQFNQLAMATAVPLPKHKTSTPHIPGNGSFAISLYYSPNINIQQVQPGERKHMEDDRNSISEGESVKSSASYGITGSYSFNKNWAVQVGLQVFKQTSVIEPKNLFARHDDRRGNPPNSGELRYKFNCAAGYVFLDPKSGTSPAFGDSVTALRSENTLSYTGIPVTVQYSTQLGKFKLNGVAGLGFNILSKSELQSNFIAATGVKTQSVDPVQGLKSMYVSGIIGAGLEYPLSQRLSVYVLPNLSFAVSPINKNTPALTKLNTFGLQSGLKFRL